MFYHQKHELEKFIIMALVMKVIVVLGGKGVLPVGYPYKV